MTSEFGPNSRYFGLPLRETADDDGTPRTHLARRIIPQATRYKAAGHLELTGDERMDAIAAQTMEDPLLYWRICDADGGADPAEIPRVPRKRLKLPLPLEISDDDSA